MWNVVQALANHAAIFLLEAHQEQTADMESLDQIPEEKYTMGGTSDQEKTGTRERRSMVVEAELENAAMLQGTAATKTEAVVATPIAEAVVAATQIAEAVAVATKVGEGKRAEDKVEKAETSKAGEYFDRLGLRYYPKLPCVATVLKKN
mmetsp:Transcript_9688/g.14003  ORF Transcript_9688/g.14003 Transcript_9688/m.14003 type:complete len:149 (+) Transcript_9688:2485-2931(+)